MMSDQMEPTQCDDVEDGAKVGNKRRSMIKCSAPLVDVGGNEQISTYQVIIPDSNTAQKSDETRKGKMWANEEIMIFYEAVKQLGKDFDGIVRIMQKKKVYKDKHQVRNFFFNCAKFLRNLCDINVDEVFPNVCRDAKELFFVINSCEWRKRTGGSKYQVERMKELILDGTTTIKSNKKNMILKTPICPALQKYFTEFRIAHPDKVSDSTLNLSLTPATYRDKNFVLSCEQNPVLNLKLSLNDRLSRVFEFLRLKWKQGTHGGEDSNRLTLYPEKETEVGRVMLTNTDPYDEIVSLNKLKREQDGIKLRSTEKKSNTAQNTVATYTAMVNRPLTLNDRIVLGGLTEDNVAEASVAELYCLCGLTTRIKMVYSIQSTRRIVETWRLFQELINREYGEQLASTSRDEDSLPMPSTSVPLIVGVVNPMTIKRSRPAPSAAEPSSKRLPEGSSIELDDMALFRRQLKKSNLNTKFSTDRRPEGKATSDSKKNEPTDFSQLMAEGCSTQPSPRRDKKWEEREGEKATTLHSEGTLHSDSIQKYVHVTMNDVLQQDSNQVIGTMAELLNTIEDTL